MRPSALRKLVSKTAEFEIICVPSTMQTRPRKRPRPILYFCRPCGLGFRVRLFDGRIFGELDIEELAVDAFDAPDVDILDHFAGLRIDRDRTARTFPGHALHRRDQRVAIAVAAGL